MNRAVPAGQVGGGEVGLVLPDVLPGQQGDAQPTFGRQRLLVGQSRVREAPLVERHGRTGMAQQCRQLPVLVGPQLLGGPPLALFQLECQP